MHPAKKTTAWNGDIWHQPRAVYLSRKSLANIWNAYLGDKILVETFCDTDGTAVITGVTYKLDQHPLYTLPSNYQWVSIDHILPDIWRSCHIRDKFLMFNRLDVRLSSNEKDKPTSAS